MKWVKNKKICVIGLKLFFDTLYNFTFFHFWVTVFLVQVYTGHNLNNMSLKFYISIYTPSYLLYTFAYSKDISVSSPVRMMSGFSIHTGYPPPFPSSYVWVG